MPIPRYRRQGGPALLSAGFRPFFLVGALWATLAIPIWLVVFAGALQLPTRLSPVVWHVHEMVFGYGSAVVTGFLLSAIPNWTGRMPLQGGPLAILLALWTLGRAEFCSLRGWISQLSRLSISPSLLSLQPSWRGRLSQDEIGATSQCSEHSAYCSPEMSSSISMLWALYQRPSGTCTARRQPQLQPGRDEDRDEEREQHGGRRVGRDGCHVGTHQPGDEQHRQQGRDDSRVAIMVGLSTSETAATAVVRRERPSFSRQCRAMFFGA
jgi:hypothetical protein